MFTKLPITKKNYTGLAKYKCHIFICVKKKEKLQFTKQFRHLFLQKILLTHFFYLSTLCGSRRGHWHLYGGTAGHCHLLRPGLQDQELQEDRLGDHCGRSAGTDHCGRSVRGFFVDHSTWIEKKNPSIDF